MSSIPKRLYKEEFPTEDDLVTATIKDINDNGVTCHLLEYDREGFVPLKELGKNFNLKQGSQDIFRVIHVDPTKGYIDLSYKYISDEEKQVHKQEYGFDKKLHAFFYHWSMQTSCDLVTNVLWETVEYESLINDTTWLTEVPESFRERILSEVSRYFEHEDILFTVQFEMVSPGGVALLDEAIKFGIAGESEIKCIYTGKSGSIGTIFQLSLVSKDLNAKMRLAAVMRTIEKFITENNGKFKAIAE